MYDVAASIVLHLGQLLLFLCAQRGTAAQPQRDENAQPKYILSQKVESWGGKAVSIAELPFFARRVTGAHRCSDALLSHALTPCKYSGTDFYNTSVLWQFVGLQRAALFYCALVP
jgi:hypothetical protein